MKNKKKIALGAGVLAAAMVFGGTFAWFQTTDSVKNQFGMENFDVAISEDFDPSVPVAPGADITKNVQIENGGNVDVVIRVKLEETLRMLEQEKGEGVDKVKLSWADSADAAKAGNNIPAKVSKEMYTAKTTAVDTKKIENATLNPTDGDVEVWQKTTTTGANTVYSYFAVKKVGTEYQLVKATPTGDDKANPNAFTIQYGYNTWHNDAASGIHGKDDATLDTYYTTAGGTGKFHNAVKLNFGDNVQVDGKALAETTTWYLADDGYFYYCKPLAGGSISEPLLKSVQFAKEAGNALRGAQYTLTPVMEAIQKDHEAVKGSWTNLTTYGDKSAVAAVNTDKEQLVYNVVAQNKAYTAGA